MSGIMVIKPGQKFPKGREQRIIAKWFGGCVETIGQLVPLSDCRPFKLVVFVGGMDYSKMSDTVGARVVVVPPVDYHRWTDKGIDYVGRLIREGTESIEIRIDKSGHVRAEKLIPF